jgi:HK97 family phage portal protein
MALRNSIRTFWGVVSGLLRLPGMQSPLPNKYSAASAVTDVSFDTAMCVSAWWAGCRLLAEVIASLPICFYYKGKESDLHPLYYLLNFKPNRYMNRVEFFETLILNLVNSGNAYIAIERLGGRIISLLPLQTSQMSTELLDDGSIVHTYYDGRNVKVYSQESIWHIKLFGNGIIGLSPLGHARQSLGIAIAAENRVSAMYRNGGKPTGVLMIDKLLTKEQRTKIRENMRELAVGNSDDLYILEAGMKYQQVSMSPEDLELVTTRRMQIEDLARFLGVPSVLINDTQGSTVWGSGIEQIIDGFHKLNLRPYFSRIEMSARVSLLVGVEQQQWSLKFDFDELTRMDMAKRFEAIGKAINNCVITPNEGRALEGRDPKPGGDELLANGTLVPLTQVRAKPQNTEIQNGR